MTDNMKKFMDAVSADEELQKELEEILELPEEERQQASSRLAEKHGFTFTEEDFEMDEELSDDELDKVSGGAVPVVAALVAAGLIFGAKKVY